MLTPDLKAEIQRTLNAASNVLPGYRPRRGQCEMIAHIARAMSDADKDTPPVLAVEAPTGTGKTLGYLAPLIPIAAGSGRKLVICTATVALQGQLCDHDLPLLQRLSARPFDFALAKGRGRYVCTARLERAMGGGTGDLFSGDPLTFDAPPSGADQATLSAMYQALLGADWDGCLDTWDRGEAIDPGVWGRITNDRHGCSGALCPHYKACPYLYARGELRGVDVVVTNHAMLLSDLDLGGGVVLPDPSESLLVIDEAHGLAKRACSHFAGKASLGLDAAWLTQTAAALRRAIGVSGVEGGRERMEAFLREGEALRVAMGDLRAWCEQAAAQFDGNGVWRFGAGVTLPDVLRTGGEHVLGHANGALDAIGGLRDRISESAKSRKGGAGQTTALLADFGRPIARLERIVKAWALMLAPDPMNAPPIARWIEKIPGRGQTGFTVEAAPTSAAVDFRRNCWPRFAGAVLTSATLTALGRFEPLLMDLGLGDREQVFTLSLPSPFDYANKATLTVPRMRADPRERDAHSAEIAELLADLVDPGEGTLLLFTSRRQMRDVLDALPSHLHDITVAQDKTPRARLVARHRKRIDAGEGSLLAGLASLAEGVDLPGVYCTHVIIAKLPFAPPDSPIEATLAEWIEAQGRSPFVELMVPQASVKLQQAVGRLLRTETDRGRITLLDRRVVTRQYGRRMLDSLPPMRRVIERGRAAA